MATFNLTTNFTNSANRERVNVYQSGAIIFSQDFAAPHGPRPSRPDGGHEWGPALVQPSKNYLYRWLEIDSNGNTLQEYGHQNFTVPSAGGLNTRGRVELIADTTAGVYSGLNSFTLDGTNGTVDIRGWDIILEKIGFGTQFTVEQPDIKYDPVTGKVEWVDPEFTISPQEKYVINFIPKVVGGTPVVATGLFSNVRTVTIDDNITPDDFGNNLIQVNGSGTYLKLTLPTIQSVAEFRPLVIKTGRGNHINVSVVSLDANAIDWLYGNLTSFYMGTQESVTIYRSGSFWQIMDYSGNFFNVGLIVNEDTPFGNAFNRVPIEGAILDIREYSRLYDWVNRLPPSQTVSFAGWNAEKTKWSLASGNQFHVADRRGLYSRAANTELPGVYMEQQLLDHKHQETVGRLQNAPFGSTAPPIASKPIGAYDRQHQELSDLTSSPTALNGAILTSIGSENRPNSVVERRYVLC